MKRLMILVVMTIWLAVSAAAVVALARGEDWKAAAGPLMTRFSEDVSPDNVHPEYPRPQMVRQDWLNLNGLWQLGMAGAGDPAPTIIKCAREEACDMIVLNDPNPGVVAGKLTREMANSEGSVSQRVAHLSDVPVVIAK